MMTSYIFGFIQHHNGHLAVYKPRQDLHIDVNKTWSRFEVPIKNFITVNHKMRYFYVV